MRDDPQSLLSSDRIQTEVSNMLTRRNIKGDNEVWESKEPVECLWSFVRNDYTVVCVAVMNKENTETILHAAEGTQLIVIYMDKCTPAATKLIRTKPATEIWSAKEMCVHPFKFAFIKDAGVMQRPLPKESDMFAKLHKDDPLSHYLGAEIGDVVWCEIVWGALGPSISNRVVVK